MSSNFQWIWWEESIVPAFDAFEDTKPDLFFGMEDIGGAIQKCLLEYKVPSVIGYYNNPFTFLINGNSYTFPQLVDSYLFSEKSTIDKIFSCDIGIVSSPTPILYDLCFDIEKYNIKIISDEIWGIPQHICMETTERKLSLYTSSRLIITDSPLEISRVISCKKARVSSVIPIIDCVPLICNIQDIEDLLGYEKVEYDIEIKSYDYAFNKIIEEVNNE
jgi:hypothetical protein